MSDTRIINGKKSGGPLVCSRPCSECGPRDPETVKLGLAHHFGDSYLGFASDEPDHPAARAGLGAWYGCKHCDAWHEDPEAEYEDPGTLGETTYAYISANGEAHLIVDNEGLQASIVLNMDQQLRLAAMIMAGLVPVLCARDGITEADVYVRLCEEADRALAEGQRGAREMQA